MHLWNVNVILLKQSKIKKGYNMEAYIQVNDLNLTIDNNLVLENISFSLEKGKCLGLAGMNGCGKTMIMKCVSGLILPTSGEIFVDGRKIGVDIDFPESLGIMIEVPGFIPFLSGFENLKSLARINNIIDDNTINQSLDKVGLDSKDKRKVKKYSLGMRQRLAIAQALMENPDLYILDEPFNGLDIKGVGEVRTILKDLKNNGKTIILSSHNPQDLEFLCDNIIRLDAGRIIE